MKNYLRALKRKALKTKMINILLTRTELYDIAKKIKVTKHAYQRMQESLDYKISKSKVVEYIKSSPLAWKQSNGQYVIMVSEYSCFVIYKYYSYYTLVSYLRKSDNNYNVIDKFIFEYKGVKKKWKDTEKTRTP